jgi:hypothetical protein
VDRYGWNGSIRFFESRTSRRRRGEREKGRKGEREPLAGLPFSPSPLLPPKS